MLLLPPLYKEMESWRIIYSVMPPIHSSEDSNQIHTLPLTDTPLFLMFLLICESPYFFLFAFLYKH